MPRERKPAKYPGTMKLVPLKVENCAPDTMRDTLNDVPFLAYHVETLADGRKVCITKPGGKSTWGHMKVNDFMVWVYDENAQERWRISHAEIHKDIEAKLESDARLATKFVDLLHEVCKGAEPDQHTGALRAFDGLPGLPAELILKVYKWIWIQEDCNYPSAQGRWLSMNGLLELQKQYASKQR